MKQLLLLVLTLASFVMSLLLGVKLYEQTIPPFNENNCIIFDHSSLYGEETNSSSSVVFATIVKNVLTKGHSEVVMIYEVAPSSYVAVSEIVSFYDLRSTNAVEVSCD